MSTNQAPKVTHAARVSRTTFFHLPACKCRLGWGGQVCRTDPRELHPYSPGGCGAWALQAVVKQEPEAGVP